MTLLWSTTNGLMPLGGIFGGLFSGLLADYFGRKNALLLINVLVVISGVLNLLSKPLKVYETILASRFVTGLFSGFFTGVLPIYLFEIAPHNLRGIVGTMNQLNIVIGILFYFINFNLFLNIKLIKLYYPKYELPRLLKPTQTGGKMTYYYSHRQEFLKETYFKGSPKFIHVLFSYIHAYFHSYNHYYTLNPRFYSAS